MDINQVVQDLLSYVTELGVNFGVSIVLAILMLVVGLWAAGFFYRLTVKGFAKTDKVDKTVALFLASLVRYGIIAVTVLAVLDQFGVETTSLVAMIGAAGLAIGLAMQGTLSNVAAGVMLLIFRPFRVGEYIDAGGVAGTVKSISLFSTHFDTPDNVRIIVPNAHIWGAAIKNFAHNDQRRVDLVIGIGYDDDIDKAMKVVDSVISGHEKTLSDPAPVIAVGELGASSVDLIVRSWCAAADYWVVRWDLVKGIKEAFDREGISIPYTHMVVQTQPLGD